MKKMNIVRHGAQKKRGFTLIELLVVIAIIGILSSVVLVSLNSARNKGSNARIQEETNQVRTQLESDFNGSTYPDLAGGASNIAATSSSVSSNINTVIRDIATLNSGSSVLNTSAAATTGVTIYTSVTTGTPTDYSIYSAQIGGGYFCISSSGNTITKTSGAIPTVTANFNTCQ